MGKGLQLRKNKGKQKAVKRQRDPETVQGTESDDDSSQAGPSSRPRLRSTLSSPTQMSALRVSCSQNKHLDFSKEEGKRHCDFLVSSAIGHGTFFNTMDDTTMDHLIVSPVDEWRLSSIAEWMPDCHLDLQAEKPSSHGPTIASDDQSCHCKQESPKKENRHKTLQASPSPHMSCNSHLGSHCRHSPEKLMRSVNSLDYSPIHDASLERRYRLVDDCLVRTLQVLLEWPRSDKDPSPSPQAKFAKQNPKSLGDDKTCNSPKKLHKSPQRSSVGDLPQSRNLKSMDTNLGHSPTAVRRRLRDGHSHFSNNKRLDAESPRAQHQDISQRLSAPWPTDLSVVSWKKPTMKNVSAISSEDSPNRRRTQVNQSLHPRKSVDAKDNRKQFQTFSQQRGKVSARRSKKRHKVSVVIVPPDCHQVLKITPGMLLSDNLINNRCVWRLIDNRYPCRIKVQKKILDTSNRRPGIAPSSNSFTPRQGGEEDCVSERDHGMMPSTSSDSLDTEMGGKTLQGKAKKGSTRTKKSPGRNKLGHTSPGPWFCRSRRMPKSSLESLTIPPLLTRQRKGVEEVVESVPESQGFIPRVGRPADDACEDGGISGTQGFIPSLTDLTKTDTQTLSQW